MLIEAGRLHEQRRARRAPLVLLLASLRCHLQVPLLGRRLVEVLLAAYEELLDARLLLVWPHIIEQQRLPVRLLLLDKVGRRQVARSPARPLQRAAVRRESCPLLQVSRRRALIVAFGELIEEIVAIALFQAALFPVVGVAAAAA